MNDLNIENEERAEQMAQTYDDMSDGGYEITQEEYEQIKDNPIFDSQAQVFNDVIQEPSEMDL